MMAIVWAQHRLSIVRFLTMMIWQQEDLDRLITQAGVKDEFSLFYVALNGLYLGIDHLFIGAELKFHLNHRVDVISLMEGVTRGR